MANTFPPDIVRFIQDEIESGQFADETELLTAALEVYREVKQRHGELREQVQRSLSRAEQGDVRPLDMESIKQRLTRGM